MHTMKKFIRYYAPYKAVFFLDLICAAVISLVDLAFPQIYVRLRRRCLQNQQITYCMPCFRLGQDCLQFIYYRRFVNIM